MSMSHCDYCGQPWQGHGTSCLTVGRIELRPNPGLPPGTIVFTNADRDLLVAEIASLRRQLATEKDLALRAYAELATANRELAEERAHIKVLERGIDLCSGTCGFHVRAAHDGGKEGEK